MMGTMVVMVLMMVMLMIGRRSGDPTPLPPPAPPPALQKVHRLVVPVHPTRVPRFGTRVGEGKG